MVAEQIFAIITRRLIEPAELSAASPPACGCRLTGLPERPCRANSTSKAGRSQRSADDRLGHGMPAQIDAGPGHQRNRGPNSRVAAGPITRQAKVTMLAVTAVWTLICQNSVIKNKQQRLQQQRQNRSHEIAAEPPGHGRIQAASPHTRLTTNGATRSLRLAMWKSVIRPVRIAQITYTVGNPTAIGK